MLYPNLKQKRERLGLTQKQIADLIGVDYKTYSHYENEDVIIPLKHLNTICNYFDLSLDYIFTFTETNQYKKSIKDIDIVQAGKRLKEIRKENKLLQNDLALMLNVARGIIGEYENGHYLISTHSLYAICKNYKISADYLVGKINSPKYLT